MIDFDSSVLIVGAGTLSKETFENVYDGQPVIAVDGGANHLRLFGVKPDVIIGDMDSVENVNDFSESKILEMSEQDSTDLEKCLMNINSPQYLAVGFLGSRFDHNFEILHVLAKYLNKDVFFFSEEDVIFRLPKEFEAKLSVGTRVSIYPLLETVFVSSQGLKYPLDGLRMEQGKMIGTSNENVQEEVKIIQNGGSAIIILPIKFFSQLFL